MISNTSFSATVFTLPSVGVAIPARLSIAVPTNAQWKGSGKSQETRQGQEMQHMWPDASFLWWKWTELSEINAKHHKRTHTSLTFRLLCPGRSIHHLKADTLHTQRIRLYQPALVKSCSLVKIQIPSPATLPLRFSHPDSLKKTELKYPLPAPVFSSHPVYRHNN